MRTFVKLAFTLLAGGVLALAADVSGTWQLTVQTSQGTGNPTVTLKQDGEQLTGTFQSQVFGEAKLTGTLKGNAIEFAFVAEAGGQSLKVSYKGTVESPTAMKGAAVYAGFDDQVTWSGVKK